MPEDGQLPEGGLMPAFIEWSPGPHPSTGQKDLGVRLSGVHLTHPDPERMTAMLKTVGVGHLAQVHASPKRALAFELETTKGNVTLD